MVNTGGLLNNTGNRETCLEARFTVSDFNFRVQIDRLVSGESDVESDIPISNRPRPRSRTVMLHSTYHLILLIFDTVIARI